VEQRRDSGFDIGEFDANGKNQGAGNRSEILIVGLSEIPGTSMATPSAAPESKGAMPVAGESIPVS
jgi:hypothetical protein